MQPITMAEAAELGVPECFSDEFAFLERTGQLPAYAGPVERDWGSDACDPYMDERWEPSEPDGFSEQPGPAWVREPDPEPEPANRPGHTDPWCVYEDCDGNCCPF